MELSFREWLVIAGAVVILGIILDAYRRIRRDKKEQEDFKKAMAGQPVHGDDYNPELPNGRARVVRPAQAMEAMPESAFLNTLKSRQEPEPSVMPVSSGFEAGTVEAQLSEEIESLQSYTPQDLPVEEDSTHAPEALQWSEDLVEQPPVAHHEDWGNYRDGDVAADSHREFVDDYHPTSADHPQDDTGFVDSAYPDQEPSFYKDDHQDDDLDVIASQESHQEGGASPDSERDVNLPDAEQEHAAPAAARSITFSDRMKKGFETLTKRFKLPEDHPANSDEVSGNHDTASHKELIVIHVESKEKAGFQGQDLKMLFEACGLVHGSYQIFHRHEEVDTSSPIQFSVSNSFEPGYFDLSEMDTLSTHGVSFFLSLPGPTNNMMAFDYMVETAQCVVRNLHGELKDENHSAVTTQTLEHCRQRIREFERKQQLSLVH